MPFLVLNVYVYPKPRISHLKLQKTIQEVFAGFNSTGKLLWNRFLQFNGDYSAQDGRIIKYMAWS
jgi:hypothetical protein